MNDMLMATDLKTALANPAAVFSHPDEVLKNPDIDREMKYKILRSWELDERNLAVATDENMPGGKESMLQEVILAIKSIADE